MIVILDRGGPPKQVCFAALPTLKVYGELEMAVVQTRLVLACTVAKNRQYLLSF